jgi:glutamate--cysteine ligase
MWPDKTRDELPIMPKGRYAIMLRHMPRVGTMGLDMMLRTCTIQANLDYGSKPTWCRSSASPSRCSRSAPRCSPIRRSPKASPTASCPTAAISGPTPTRTAPACCRSCSKTASAMNAMRLHALDVPMYFVFRDGKYIDAAGKSFRDFMNGKLPALPGEKPTDEGLDDHLSTAFPEVRLKSFLEMRGADGGPWSRICALPALWVGLLYDQGALDAAWDLVKDWSMDCAFRPCSAGAARCGSGNNETGYLCGIAGICRVVGQTPAESAAGAVSWCMGRRFEPRLCRRELLNRPRHHACARLGGRLH